MALAAIVERREAIVIAFHEGTDDRRYPAYHRDKGQDEDGNGVDGLPEAVAQCECDAAAHVFQQLIEFKIVFLSIDQRFGLLGQIGKERGTDDQYDIFKKGEIEEEENDPDHQVAHQEEEVQECILLMLEPAGNADEFAEFVHGFCGRPPEEIQTRTEQQRIQDARNDDPLP